IEGNTDYQQHPQTSAAPANGKVTNTFHIFRPGRFVRSIHHATDTPTITLDIVTVASSNNVLRNSSNTRGRINNCQDSAQPVSLACKRTYNSGRQNSSSNKATNNKR